MPLGFSQHLKTGATLVRVKLKSLKIHHPPPDLEDLGDVWEIWGVNTILPRKGFLTWETYRIHQGFGWRHGGDTPMKLTGSRIWMAGIIFFCMNYAPQGCLVSRLVNIMNVIKSIFLHILIFGLNAKAGNHTGCVGISSQILFFVWIVTFEVEWKRASRSSGVPTKHADAERLKPKRSGDHVLYEKSLHVIYWHIIHA